MYRILILLIIFSPYFLASQEDIFGIWKAIDETDGQVTSHIEIYQKDGLLYGKISKILKGPDTALCDHCDGVKHKKPILGMQIIWDMEDKGKNWKGGRIMDPGNGKTYKCRIELKNDILEVRGYVGMPALGRTQIWHRVI